MEFETSEILRLRENNAELLQAIQNLLPFLDSVQDAGPIGSGWKSDELIAAIENAEGAVANATKTRA